MFACLWYRVTRIVFSFFYWLLCVHLQTADVDVASLRAVSRWPRTGCASRRSLIWTRPAVSHRRSLCLASSATRPPETSNAHRTYVCCRVILQIMVKVSSLHEHAEILILLLGRGNTWNMRGESFVKRLFEQQCLQVKFCKPNPWN